MIYLVPSYLLFFFITETKRRHPGVKESAEEAIVKEQISFPLIFVDFAIYTGNCCENQISSWDLLTRSAGVGRYEHLDVIKGTGHFFETLSVGSVPGADHS